MIREAVVAVVAVYVVAVVVLLGTTVLRRTRPSPAEAAGAPDSQSARERCPASRADEEFLVSETFQASYDAAFAAIDRRRRRRVTRRSS